MKLSKLLQLIQTASADDLGAWLNELEKAIPELGNPLDVVSVFRVLKDAREHHQKESRKDLWVRILRHEHQVLDKIAQMVHTSSKKAGMKRLFRSQIGMEVSYVFD